MRQFNTLVGFLASKSSNPQIGDTVEFLWYENVDDGGGATWVFKGVTGQTPSQSPEQLVDALLNDANGNQWAIEGRSSINILSLGGNPNNADNLPFIQAAVNTPSPVEVHYPNVNGGVYDSSAKPTGQPKGTVSIFHASASINPQSSYPIGTLIFDYTDEFADTSYSLVRARGDDLDRQALGGNKVNGHKVLHEFGGANATGGRHAIYGVATHTSATSPSNTDRNYVAVTGLGLGSSSTGDGGADTGAGALGSLFASNFLAVANSGYINTKNVTAGEMNTKMEAGSSTKYHSILQLVSDDEVQGTETDAGLSISAKGGVIGLKNGILIGNQNGENPIDPVAGTLFKASPIAGNSPCHRGIDLFGYDISSFVFLSKVFRVSNTGSVDIGDPTVASQVMMDLRSSGLAADYDVRISSSGGTATDGQGSAEYLALTHSFKGAVRPLTDTVGNLGTGGFRWAEVFAVNGTINTSDERRKQQQSEIDDLILDAWANIPKVKFKWSASVDDKGDGARWHFGVMAQDIEREFAKVGLNGFDYGVLCYDEWEETERVTPDKVNSDGVVIEKGKTIISPAGNGYGVRYAQAAQLDAALERRERKRLEAKIDLLLSKQAN